MTRHFQALKVGKAREYTSWDGTRKVRGQALSVLEGPHWNLLHIRKANGDYTAIAIEKPPEVELNPFSDVAF